MRAALAALAATTALVLGAGAALAQSSSAPAEDAETPKAEQQRDSETLPTPVAERVATLVVLDKFTSTTETFEVHPGEDITHGRLVIHVRSCEANPPWERPESAAFLQVDERTRQGAVKRVYSGWMFARAPALHPFDHPAYNVMVKNCKMSFPDKGEDTVVLTPPSASSPPEAPAAAEGDGE